ncbi:hypothetical protein [Paraburkholderia phosphatilytica]|uniref:hypothetical protein n=1 Tax=Paraburkholderia phosphatilytica TaxID=2282883 RepID=UPI001F0C4558|nr:hypothetical protein [Paraburkholderia phosphatilytica]
MPNAWFPLGATVINAVLSGIAYVLATVYTSVQFFIAQARLSTSTGGWLDLFAVDYFGSTGLQRNANEADGSYQSRISINMLRERGTRRAVISILTQLTGNAPTIIEPSRPQDTGAYGYAMGYGVAGAYGSLLYPYQAFITAYRPVGKGIPYVNGYGNYAGGYSTPSRASYVDISDVATGVSDAQIYAAIASVMPAATIAWVSITNPPA